jgi:hypothetical protein
MRRDEKLAAPITMEIKPYRQDHTWQGGLDPIVMISFKLLTEPGHIQISMEAIELNTHNMVMNKET